MDEAGSHPSPPVLTWPGGPREVRLPAGEVHVWSARLDAKPEQIQAGWQVLSSDERERADRFRFSQDRLHFVAARVILRALVGRYLEIPGTAARFRYGPFGKPSLDAGHGSDLRFNVAHSGEVALYAFARLREVGLDVEAVRSARVLAGVSDSSFSEAERQALTALSPERRGLATLGLWTRKEAYLKALGSGLQQDLASFEVSVPPAAPALLRAPALQADAKTWGLHDLQPAPDFVGALCVEGGSEVRAWSWNPA